jgi:hypothetical protein
MPLLQGIDAVPLTVCAYANHRARLRKRLFAYTQIQLQHFSPFLRKNQKLVMKLIL